MTVVLRRAGPADLDRLVELWNQMWEFHSARDPRFAPSPLASTVARHSLEMHLENPLSAVFAAEAGGRILGYLVATILENVPVVLNPAFGFVVEIAVDRAARRRSIGRKLVEEAHAWFRSKLVSSVEVNVSVRNAASRGFWRRMGYKSFLERLQLSLA